MADRKGNSGKILVAAIDFGTTYSGYAYSFKHEFERDPLKIYSNLWNDGMGLITHKAPTSVLFDERGDFHSFGYEAEEKYAQLSSSDKHIGWKYFRRFKMILHNKSNLKMNTKLRDDQGKRMDAIKVFSAAISYLKKHLVDKLNESNLAKNNSSEEGAQNYGICNFDILWVLTVPAIWNDSAKQFMRLAAVQGGIPENQLRLALEPEAAAILSIKGVLLKKSITPMAFKKDLKFMVIDLGGGTVDITIHKVADDEKFHEIHPPSGGPWGGTLVDEQIYDFFENIFGREVLGIFKKECATDYIDMLKTLELKKREFKRPADDDLIVNLTLPSSLFDIYAEENKGSTIDDKLKELFQNNVEKKRGRLRIRKDIIENMFMESIDNLKSHLHSMFRKPEMREVNTIVLVGGYSDSGLLKSKLKESFIDKQIIVPEEASTAVLKGAVIFGHQPDVIDSRKAPCTYGISTAVPFDPNLHLESHRYHDKCEDVFKVFIAVGMDIIPGTTTVKYEFNSAKSNVIEIYKSILETPVYTTDPGCERIGEVCLDLPGDTPVMVNVTMLFGDTELRVEAQEMGSKKTISAKFKFVK